MKAAVLALLIALSAFAQQQQEPKIRASSIGSDSAIPHIIYGGEWQTQIVLTNTRDTQANVSISFFNGADARPLAIPFVNRTPQEKISIVLPAGGSAILQTEEPKDTFLAWGIVNSLECDDYCRGIYGNTILRNRNATRPDFETSFPFDGGSYKEIFIPFDNRNWFSTLVMLSYTEDFTFYDDATITMTCRNEGGSRIVLDQFKLKRGEFKFFNLVEKYPSTLAASGTCEIQSNQYSVVLNGLRMNPTNAFSAIYGVGK